MPHEIGPFRMVPLGSVGEPAVLVEIDGDRHTLDGDAVDRMTRDLEDSASGEMNEAAKHLRETFRDARQIARGQEVLG